MITAAGLGIRGPKLILAMMQTYAVSAATLSDHAH